jgi:predicted TIM-barrel fold metal-dependent hydrolase
MWAWRLDQERFSATEYRAEASGLGVIKTVHVQHATMAAPAAAETAWLQTVADRYEWPNAIMARGFLADPAAPKELETHTPYANFRGIRDCSEMKLLGTSQWNAGYKTLLGLGGICELMITHAGIPVVSKLDDYQQAWRTALRKLAQAPNVVVKISGLSSGAPANFYAVTMRQWIRECVETFGPERSMFASNFHVERLFVTLPKLFRTYRRAVEDYTPAEQDMMFAGTAERVYRI